MKFLYLIFIASFLFAQGRPQTNVLFPSGQDSILETGASDTLQYRLGIGGKWSAYYTLTETITTAEKVAETNEVVDLSGDSNWQWAEFVQLKIYNGARNITSNVFYIGDKAGAVTAILVPDSVNANILLYTNSIIGGN